MLLKHLGFPFRRTDMAKTALKNKAAAKPKFRCAIYALPGLRSSSLRLPQVRPLPHLPS